MTQQSYAVIMAGGKGTRFWPLSRARRPKQLLKILSRKSLVRETLDRIVPLFGRDRILVVTVAEQYRALRKELAILPAKNFLIEPEGKNTAPCLGLAAIELSARNPDAVMVILPADHWVSDPAPFHRTLREAIGLAARSDSLVTIGIRPSYAETGYGYILKGTRLNGKTNIPAFRVRRFQEKPSAKKARQLIRLGSLWNSGIFAWKSSVLLEMLSRYNPPVFRGLTRIQKGAEGKALTSPNPALRALLRREYKKMPNISIDHSVLEKAGSAGRVWMVEANFAWSDVGSWAAVHRMLPRDKNGNAGTGKWLAIQSSNSLVHAPDRLVVLLGLNHAVVVDTNDALFVGDIRRAQEVRDLIGELKRQGFGRLTIR